MTQFVFHTDPGHGWLEVPHQVLAELGQTHDDYSPYSYRDAQNVYLEEDCDAGDFILAWRQRNGAAPELVERYHDGDHWIRALDDCGGARWVSPFERGKA